MMAMSDLAIVADANATLDELLRLLDADDAVAAAVTAVAAVTDDAEAASA
jgi:hypothetical protein